MKEVEKEPLSDQNNCSDMKLIKIYYLIKKEK